MPIRIVIFANGISPSEHLHGLLLIASQSNETDVFLIGGLSDNTITEWQDIFGKRLIFVSRQSYMSCVRVIAASDLVFGMPGSFLWMRLLSSMRLLKFMPYFFGPGFVTKAVGYFKHPERGAWPAIKTRFKFYLFNTHFVCANDIDRVYLAAALGYPLSRTISAPLPKHIHINKMLVDGSKMGAKKGILFAPTHRWGNVIPPLTTLMADGRFVAGLVSQGFDIFHSSHPETPFTELDSRVQNFNKDWSRISCIVTDYSSIGEDFLLSGGQHLLAHMPDRQEFEAKQGSGPFFNSSMGQKTVSTSLCELNRALERLSEAVTATPISPVPMDKYFCHLLAKRKIP